MHKADNALIKIGQSNCLSAQRSGSRTHNDNRFCAGVLSLLCLKLQQSKSECEWCMSRDNDAFAGKKRLLLHCGMWMCSHFIWSHRHILPRSSYKSSCPLVWINMQGEKSSHAAILNGWITVMISVVTHFLLLRRRWDQSNTKTTCKEKKKYSKTLHGLYFGVL